jgi:hypothetical protein
VDADNSTKKSVDPRFSELSGKLNTEIFTKSYQFLDEEQEKEIAVMEKKLSKTKSPHTREHLREELRMSGCSPPSLLTDPLGKSSRWLREGERPKFVRG